MGHDQMDGGAMSGIIWCFAGLGMVVAFLWAVLTIAALVATAVQAVRGK